MNLTDRFVVVYLMLVFPKALPSLFPSSPSKLTLPDNQLPALFPSCSFSLSSLPKLILIKVIFHKESFFFSFSKITDGNQQC